MNVLLLTSHSIAEYDDLRMLTDLGYDVFSIGAYTDPANPTDDKRPALPDAPYHEVLAQACDVQRGLLGDPGPNIDWAKAALHEDVIAWADVIIIHHFPERWIVPQWENIKRKRVIWRTCGQSSPFGETERMMAPLVADGLEIVRYSPAERNLPDYAGESALIRFGKYPSDYGPWVGDQYVVGNVTQDMRNRGDSCGYGFWLAATAGLPTRPAGPGSEALLGGVGALEYDAMLDYLRHLRVYLYTGTQPASYTLGLMEAMLSGVPVVSIGANAFGWPELFEAAIPHDALQRQQEGREPRGYRSLLAEDSGFDNPMDARRELVTYLQYPDKGENVSRHIRERAVATFGIETIGAHWKAFLG
jgi:hypothetical protein